MRSQRASRSGVSGPRRQPLLHDLLPCVHAPTQVWSGRDGQIRNRGVQGVYHADVRVLSQAVLTLDGVEPEPVMSTTYGASSVGIAGLLRSLDVEGADPTFRVDRSRRVWPGRVDESVTLSTGGGVPLTVLIRVALSCDLATIHEVNGGGAGVVQVAKTDGEVLLWENDAVSARLWADGAHLDLTHLEGPTLEWTVTVEPAVPATVTWNVEARDLAPVVLPARGSVEWARPAVQADDRRIPALLEVSLDDLAGLRMATPERPDDTFLAAGAPWFFTLFGRDSLWAARMLLPLGTELAAGTLRLLASRQGTSVDRDTGEEPGKILHEVRRGTFALRAGHSLPPVYFGTVDATPLWVCLLHDAWRWGMPDADVAALLPAVRRALSWMADFGDGDSDGLLEYVDRSGRGLANQGWKDSRDSVQWRDGRLAEAPIALAEVQGYAHEAALGGAALLAALGDGDDDADRWLEWAAVLADRFRQRFWVDDGAGPYPAIALDASKRPVDSLTSNIGHLLGTGLLDEEESAAVARRLVSSTMNSGFGLRTMSTAEAGYWALRYHGGAVWPHDTAITVGGLARAGHVDAAAALANGLLAAAPAFDYRLPELYSGDARAEVRRPVPYPAACRPQAWSAASAVAVVSASLGLAPDVPRGTLDVRPAAPSPVGALEVRGLRLAGAPLDVAIAADGTVRSVSAAPGITVRTTTPHRAQGTA